MSSVAPAIGRLFSFVAGTEGAWRAEQIHCMAGASLSAAPRVSVVPGPVVQLPPGAAWSLRGMASNERYVERAEKAAVTRKQAGLGRESSTCAALIPLRKNAPWWALTQDERRDLFEAQSHHIEIGIKYLPAVARPLHHCRDLGPDEPFDFLTWFEYAPGDADAFAEMLLALRASPEWAYVEREADIRLVRHQA